MENSKIEWTDHTLNFWIGCQEVSPACDECYARVQNEYRKWVNGWGPAGERRRTAPSTWQTLRKLNRAAEQAGIRARVFSNSLSDFFDNKAHHTWRREAWHYVEQSPHLDFLILTKRPQNIARMLPDPDTGVRPWGEGWPNVWLGCTVENQEEADRRIPHLLAVPATVHFLSCEPLLGAVDLDRWLHPLTHEMADCSDGMGAPDIDWIICGGESGANARPMHPDWARSLRDQCAAAGVPFFFKQWGEWREFDNYGTVEEVFDNDIEPILAAAINPAFLAPDGRFFKNRTVAPFDTNVRVIERVGKKVAGAVLDGREHREFPR